MPKPFSLDPKPPKMHPEALMRWHYSQADRHPARSAERQEHLRLAAEISVALAAAEARKAKLLGSREKREQDRQEWLRKYGGTHA